MSGNATYQASWITSRIARQPGLVGNLVRFLTLTDSLRRSLRPCYHP